MDMLIHREREAITAKGSVWLLMTLELLVLPSENSFFTNKI